VRDGILAPKDLVSEANKLKNLNAIFDYIAKNTSNTKATRKDIDWSEWLPRFNLSREELLKHASNVRPSEFQVPPGIVNLVNAIKTTGQCSFAGAQDESDLCVRCDYTTVARSGHNAPPKTVMARGYNGSVFAIPELGLVRRAYRLVVLDPPFGWNVGGAHWDKTVIIPVFYSHVISDNDRHGARTITCLCLTKSCLLMSLTSGSA